MNYLIASFDALVHDHLRLLGFRPGLAVASRGVAWRGVASRFERCLIKTKRIGNATNGELVVDAVAELVTAPSRCLPR